MDHASEKIGLSIKTGPFRSRWSSWTTLKWVVLLSSYAGAWASLAGMLYADVWPATFWK